MPSQEFPVLEPSILFEDEALLVLAKPSGLVVHADGRTKEATLVDWLRERYPGLAEIGGEHTLDSGRYTERFGVLHRIDRETSGVILVAKTGEAFGFFQQQFLERTIVKVYDAIVWGTFTEKEGRIDLPIGRSRSDFRRWSVPPDARGTLRVALTEWRVSTAGKGVTHLEVRPKTGRTHQIRVHMKAIGHTIVSDTRYGGAPALGLTRLALHARAITITLLDGAPRTFAASLPEDMSRAITDLSA